MRCTRTQALPSQIPLEAREAIVLLSPPTPFAHRSGWSIYVEPLVKFHLFISSYSRLQPGLNAQGDALSINTNWSLSSVYLFWDVKYLARSKNTLLSMRHSVKFGLRFPKGTRKRALSSDCSLLNAEEALTPLKTDLFLGLICLLTAVRASNVDASMLIDASDGQPSISRNCALHCSLSKKSQINSRFLQYVRMTVVYTNLITI